MPRKLTPLPDGSHPSAYGGILRNRSLGRGARKLSVRHSMHVVLRSTLARGIWSFVHGANRTLIESVLAKHALRSGVQILALGNAGNHLHLRIKFSHRKHYLRFVRAVTGEIALKIKKIPNPEGVFGTNFWDKRPFSSIVSGIKYVTRLIDYIKINELEGRGHARAYARLIVKRWNSRAEEKRTPLLT